MSTNSHDKSVEEKQGFLLIERDALVSLSALAVAYCESTGGAVRDDVLSVMRAIYDEDTIRKIAAANPSLQGGSNE